MCCWAMGESEEAIPLTWRIIYVLTLPLGITAETQVKLRYEHGPMAANTVV